MWARQLAKRKNKKKQEPPCWCSTPSRGSPGGMQQWENSREEKHWSKTLLYRTVISQKSTKIITSRNESKSQTKASDTSRTRWQPTSSYTGPLQPNTITTQQQQWKRNVKKEIMRLPQSQVALLSEGGKDSNIKERKRKQVEGTKGRQSSSWADTEAKKEEDAYMHIDQPPTEGKILPYDDINDGECWILQLQSQETVDTQIVTLCKCCHDQLKSRRDMI